MAAQAAEGISDPKLIVTFDLTSHIDQKLRVEETLTPPTPVGARVVQAQPDKIKPMKQTTNGLEP